MMRFIRMLLSFEYVCRIDRNEKQADEKEGEKLFDDKTFASLLVNAKGKDFIPDDEQNYAYLLGKGILDKDSAKSIFNGFMTIGRHWDNLQHKWKEDLNPIKMDEVWEKFCSRVKDPDYRTQLLIWIIIIAPTDDNDKAARWFRLCRNLICNTTINDKKDMRWLILKLYELNKETNFGLENK